MADGRRPSMGIRVLNRFISVWGKLHGEDSSGNDTPIQTETDGELKIINYGKDTSANLLPMRTEATTGEQHYIVNGKDSGGAIDPFRTNANMQQQIEVVDGTSSQKRVVDPIAVPAAEDDVWTPGLGSTIYLDVEFEFANVDGTNNAEVSLGIDVGNDGAASNSYWLVDYDLVAKSLPIRLGPYRIGGDDAIRAVAEAANDVVLSVFIIREGTAT